jgi:hypothetical protein
MLAGDMLEASAALLGAPPLRGLRTRKKRAGPVPGHPRMESARPPTSRPSTSRRRGPGRLPPLRTGVGAAAPAALASAVSVLRRWRRMATAGPRRRADASEAATTAQRGGWGRPAGPPGPACSAYRAGTRMAGLGTGTQPRRTGWAVQSSGRSWSGPAALRGGFPRPPCETCGAGGPFQARLASQGSAGCAPPCFLRPGALLPAALLPARRPASSPAGTRRIFFGEAGQRLLGLWGLGLRRCRAGPRQAAGGRAAERRRAMPRMVVG